MEHPFQPSGGEVTWTSELSGGVLHEYSRRRITHPSDDFDALLGIVSDLSDRFKTGFFFGIPDAHFLNALLWAGLGLDGSMVAKCKALTFPPGAEQGLANL